MREHEGTGPLPGWPSETNRRLWLDVAEHANRCGDGGEALDEGVNGAVVRLLRECLLGGACDRVLGCRRRRYEANYEDRPDR